MTDLKTSSLRALWFVAIGCATVAYLAAVLPQRHALASVDDRERALYRSINRDDEMLAHEPDIQRAREQLRAAVLQIGRGSPAAAAELLETLERLGRRFGLRIVSVRPTTTGSESARAPGTLAGDDVEIELVGRFRSILSALGALTGESKAVEVDTADLSVAKGEVGVAPVLHATIGVRLYALASEWERGEKVARPGTTR